MDYDGYIATIPVGSGGFTGEKNNDNIPVTELIEATNIRFDGDTIRKVGGLTKVDANAVTGTPTCLAGVDYWVNVSAQRQVTVWSSGKIYKESSGDLDGVELGTGFTFGAPVYLLPCGQELVGNSRKLIVFCKGVAPQVLTADGATVSALSNVSADWSGSNYPAAGIIHDNRVVAWGNANGPHVLYFSALDDHTNFKLTDPSNASSFPLPIFDVAPGEGEYITACHSIGTTRLFVFKYPFGIYFIDTDYLSSLIAPVTTVRKDIGCPSPKGITKVGQLGTWFIGHDGHIYSLDMLADPDAEVRNACLTRNKKMSKWIKDNILPSRLPYAQLLYDSNRGEVRATYTSASGSSNDIMLIFDVNDPNNIRISMDNRGTYYNAVWLAKGSTTYYDIYCGGTDGFVRKDNQASRVIDTATAYTAVFRTPDSDFKYLNPQFTHVNKRFDFLEIRAENPGSSTLSVEVYIDSVYYNTFTVNFSSGASVLDTGVMDSFILDTESFVRKMVKIGGFGRTISLRCYNNTASSDMSISTLIVYFDTLDSGGEI